MRRGIFTSWPRKITFVIRHPDNPVQALMFTSRRSYIWWMIQRPTSAWKHFLLLIQRLFQQLMLRVVRILVLVLPSDDNGGGR
jgi:hypothetical protein